MNKEKKTTKIGEKRMLIVFQNRHKTLNLHRAHKHALRTEFSVLGN